MGNRSYKVRALWDDEARVFYSESDIEGLHVEASSFDEFEAAVMDVAPELIVANHISSADFARKSFRDLVPAIVLERPAEPVT